MLKKSPHYDNEKELVASLQEGRREALGFLYDKYAPVLLGLIHQIIGNTEEAEEIFTNSFVRIWQEIGSYDSSKGSLAFWMLLTTRAVALEAYQSAKDPSYYPSSESGERTNGELEKGKGKEKERVQESFPSPVSVKKIVFDLIFFKGYNCAEAANELGISIEEVQTTFRVAIKELRAGSKA